MKKFLVLFFVLGVSPAFALCNYNNAPSGCPAECPSAAGSLTPAPIPNSGWTQGATTTASVDCLYQINFDSGHPCSNAYGNRACMTLFFPHERPENLYWIFCWHGGGFSGGEVESCFGQGITTYSPVALIQLFLDTPNPVGGKGIGIIEVESLLSTAPGVNTFPAAGWQSPKCAVWYALANRATFGGNWNVVGNYGPSAGGTTAWWVGQTSDTLYPAACPTPASRPPGGYRTAAAWPPMLFGQPAGNSFLDHTTGEGVTAMYYLLNANSTATVQSQDAALRASPNLNITQSNYAYLSQPLLLQFGVSDTLVQPSWNSGAGGNSVTPLASYAALSPPLHPANTIYPNCGHECDLNDLPFAPSVTAAFRFLIGTPPAGPPQINAVVNGASFLPGIAPGAWITIMGANLSATTRSWTDSDFSGNNLPTQLDGVSVTVNGKAAYVFYVSPTQLNVLSPDDAARGAEPVQVSTPQGKSTVVSAAAAGLSPALFTFSQQGGKYAAAVRADGTFLAPPNLIPGLPTAAARLGDTILLFGTGFGPTTPPSPIGQFQINAAAVANPVTVRIGGVVAATQFAGIVTPGLYQFNVVVPSVPSGDNAVSVSIGGVATQANVFLDVGR